MKEEAAERVTAERESTEPHTRREREVESHTYAIDGYKRREGQRLRRRPDLYYKITRKYYIVAYCSPIVSSEDVCCH